MKINFSTASFKDFENIPDASVQERADLHYDFLQYMKNNGHLNYRLLGESGCGPSMGLSGHGQKGMHSFISLVSNDYLGFTQHPKVKAASIAAIEQYGTGAGASPLIGGYYTYHKELEDELCQFFNREIGSTLIYNTGYTANSSSLMSLLQKEDIAIVDMAVHASVFEGIQLTNTKRFLHNNMDDLERILKMVQPAYRTKLIIVDGIYSQDGDMAHLPEIYALAKTYGALLMVDDAHGIGVIGEKGKGVLQHYDMMDKVDFITGTFSKTFGNIGGYVVSNPKMTAFLQYQSRQNAFSATSSPAVAGVSQAIKLLSEEPQWQSKLWENINYFKTGLKDLGLEVGNSHSAIIPVKIGDPHKTSDAGRILLEQGIYTNPILYPAVSKKDARIRMSLMATHTIEQLDKVLNGFEFLDKKLHIAKIKYKNVYHG
ncbi:MAG TPA: aminotransferase class I/II-fold pyridoxal phosphate-dependent enzyme [Arachidicoccus sp.]|nr:aminotransferase class I/II-fold pyridoxal phosphate-dependent enzyme [Arachidicoccus sp.]